MNSAAVGLSLASFVVVMVTVVNYFRGIAEAKVTVEVTGLATKLVFGIALAAAAIMWGVQRGGLGLAVIVPAASSTMVASGMLWLLTQRKTPVGEIKVHVGDKLLAFEATTSEGTPFHSDELRGRRTLLKFFRGGW